ncbi:universal stress protein [Microlunatus aurantiacus]|uniref:Universal stress protein n=1 Tax=Microlunatus aurantiacus TaxID=446786 RepID=A0ABP7D5Y5_9ACTN
MSVVVAHQASTIGQVALREAAKEASLRHAPLAVIHVAEGVDLDVVEAHKAGVGDQITKVLTEIGLDDLEWTLQVTTGEDVGEAVLDVVGAIDAELLVIGARRRSPVGKLFLGSVTQNIILHADVPVLVVKAPAA